MSPVATSHEPGLLEHPAEAFDYYQQVGVSTAICEEKHMGSRAVLIICRDESVAQRRFGIENEGIGICYTRTGRRFFHRSDLEAELLARVNAALTASHFWETLETDWVCLDCELMPWSVKAQGLLREQYAAVGAAAERALGEAVACLQQAKGRGIEVGAVLERTEERDRLVRNYRTAYRQYCWPVESITDLKLAPFHILATEGKVHLDKTHAWHLEHIARASQHDTELLLATQSRIVDLNDPNSRNEAIQWWLELTAKGGEGMVVKSLNFLHQTEQGLAQPAVKCRGVEYLRIIYGPEYTMLENLERLRQRGLNRKRSLAFREFVLGIEALERFVACEPLRRVHECVFGVLALESEPVDPRL